MADTSAVDTTMATSTTVDVLLPFARDILGIVPTMVASMAETLDAFFLLGVIAMLLLCRAPWTAPTIVATNETVENGGPWGCYPPREGSQGP